MSDIEHDDHEEIARRLREDGQNLGAARSAGEVMTRVLEPRRSPSAFAGRW
jgi:hypothetical protein